MPEEALLMVAGSGRSGTTFLAKILDSHPTVVYRHEPDSVLVNSDIPFLPTEADLSSMHEDVRVYLRTLMNVHTTKVCGHRPIFDKDYRSGLRRKLFGATIYVVKGIERTGISSRLPVPEFAKEPLTREKYKHLIKTVNSVGRVRLFTEAVPELKVLHIVRHPAAVVASRLRGIEQGVMGAANYIDALFDSGRGDGYGLSRDQLKAASFEEQAAFQWMTMNETTYREMLGNPNYRLVIYEDLCSDLSNQVRDLFEFCNLNWNSQTQAFLNTLSESGNQPKNYFDIVRPPASSLEKWKNELRKEKIEKIKSVVIRSELGRMYFEEEHP